MTTVVSVAQGGTGSNSAALARTALGVPPSAAYDQANTARDQANTARTQANSAYAQANSAYSDANTRLSASGGTLAGDLIITGNLTVSGNSTTLNTEILTVEDADIVLLSNVASTPALNAGIIVNRGTSTNTFLRWDEVTDKWGWSDDGSTTYKFNSALDAYAQANSAYGAANNRVLKAGDTMTGQLNISAGGLLVTGNVGIGTSSPGAPLNVKKNSAAAVVEMLRLTNDGPGAGSMSKINFDASGTSYGAITGGYGASGPQMKFELPSSTSGSWDWIYQSTTLATLLTSGNLGIGTSSPATKLDTAGTVRSTTQTVPSSGTGAELYYDATNAGLRGYNRTGAAYVNLALNDNMYVGGGSSGNLGIGTSSPQSKLEVATSSGNFSHFGATSTASGEFTGITLGYRENNSSYRKAAIVQEQIGDNSARGHLHLLVDIANDGGSAVLGDSKLMIHGTTGYVGIGTPTPGAKLDVYASSGWSQLRLNGASGGEFLLSKAGTLYGQIYASDSASTGMVVNAAQSNYLYLQTNSTNALTINNSQKVGIGTTSPITKLDVLDATATNRAVTIRRGAQGSEVTLPTTFGYPYLQIGGNEYRASSLQSIGFGYVTSGSNPPGEIGFVTTSTSGLTYGDFVIGTRNVYTDTAVTERVRITSAGDVGVGTTNPLAKLDVIGNTYVRSGVLYTDTIYPYSGNQLTFLQGGSNYIYINGKVGIGTTTPVYKQDVEGISYNRGEIIRPSVYGGDNSGTNHIIGSYILGAGKYWTVTSGAKYVHILLPARYNANTGASLMWCIEVKGYDFNAARIINLMIGGYVTPVSNGGPMSQVAVWDSAGSGVYSPTAYFSSNYNRGVARFYLSSAYYASFTINTIASGNGDVIAPDELTIIESVNATI